MKGIVIQMTVTELVEELDDAMANMAEADDDATSKRLADYAVEVGVELERRGVDILKRHDLPPATN